MLLVADLIALVHALFVVYIGGGVVAILLGWWRNWAWTRAFWFRFTHLVICVIVLLFEVANQPCPLTVFERQARDAAGVTAYESGFIAHYISRTIHFNVPPWVLSGPTFLLAATILVLYWRQVSRAAPEGGCPPPHVGEGRREQRERGERGNALAPARESPSTLQNSSEQAGSGPRATSSGADVLVPPKRSYCEGGSEADGREPVERRTRGEDALAPTRERADVSEANAGRGGRDESSSPTPGRGTPPEPETPARVRYAEYLGLFALIVVALPLANHGIESRCPWWHSSDASSVAIVLSLGLLLCMLDRKAAGLQLGDTSHWRVKDLWLLCFWVVPPLATILVYGQFTTRPYHEKIDWPCWLMGSVAQELVFFGFVYGRLVKRWGQESAGWRGALSMPVLLSALMFSLWHWSNLLELDWRFVAFQMVYTFVGAVWCLQMRRWTGSLLPGITNHILVNYLASVL